MLISTWSADVQRLAFDATISSINPNDLKFSPLRVQHSLLRCLGPHRLHPHPLWNAHPDSDWTNVLLRESTQPIRSLQIEHWGHGGVSRFMPTPTGTALLGIMGVQQSFYGIDSVCELLMRWRLNKNQKFRLEVWLQEHQQRKSESALCL